MKEVLIKGRHQYILTRDEDIPTEVIENGKALQVVGDIPHTVRDAMISQPFRAILIHGVGLDDKLYRYYVYWYAYDPQKSIELDQRIQSGEDDEQLFTNTAVLSYQKTKCLGKCGNWYDTLITPIYEYRITNKSKLNAMVVEEYEKCPECGGSFRQPVLVVLSKLVDGDMVNM